MTLWRTVGTVRMIRRMGFASFVCFVLLCCWLLSAATARVYFSYQCADHVWTMIGGCIWGPAWHGTGKYFGNATVLPPVWDDVIFGSHQHWHGLADAHWHKPNNTVYVPEAEAAGPLPVLTTSTSTTSTTTKATTTTSTTTKPTEAPEEGAAAVVNATTTTKTTTTPKPTTTTTTTTTTVTEETPPEEEA